MNNVKKIKNLLSTPIYLFKILINQILLLSIAAVNSFSYSEIWEIWSGEHNSQLEKLIGMMNNNYLVSFGWTALVLYVNYWISMAIVEYVFY